MHTRWDLAILLKLLTCRYYLYFTNCYIITNKDLGFVFCFFGNIHFLCAHNLFQSIFDVYSELELGIYNLIIIFILLILIYGLNIFGYWLKTVSIGISSQSDVRNFLNIWFIVINWHWNGSCSKFNIISFIIDFIFCNDFWSTKILK